MAKIEFDNSYDLINYLCKEDILGELQVSFTTEWSYELTPSFNFDYPELDEHLSIIFFQWLQHSSPASELHVQFKNAQDFSVQAVETYDMGFSNSKLREVIDDEVKSILNDELEVEDAYALIDIEGPNFKLEDLTINTFKIEGDPPEDNEDALEQVDERIRDLILSSILDLISKEIKNIECLDNFQMTLNIHGDDLELTAFGSPFMSSLYDFEDGECFTLDTELLKPILKKNE